VSKNKRWYIKFLDKILLTTNFSVILSSHNKNVMIFTTRSLGQDQQEETLQANAWRS
jgi:hypothetical protein